MRRALRLRHAVDPHCRAIGLRGTGTLAPSRCTEAPMNANDVASEGLRLISRLAGAVVAVPVITGYVALGAAVVIGRFTDGRLEERFAFELDPLLSPLGSLVWFFLSGFVSRWFRQGSPASAIDRLRLVRPSDSSRSPLAV